MANNYSEELLKRLAIICDFEKWMEDVLCKLPYYNRDGRDIAELLPKDWAASRQHVTE